MKKYSMEFTIEWVEECEATSFEEAERIMIEKAKRFPSTDITLYGDVEEVEK